MQSAFDHLDVKRLYSKLINHYILLLINIIIITVINFAKALL